LDAFGAVLHQVRQSRITSEEHSVFYFRGTLGYQRGSHKAMDAKADTALRNNRHKCRKVAAGK
jgi:hypothetical protein